MSERDDRKLGRKLFSVYEATSGKEEYALVLEADFNAMQAYYILLRAVAEGAEELERKLRELGKALFEEGQAEKVGDQA